VRPNGSGLSCAHETLTYQQPDSAKITFKKCPVLGVSLKPLLCSHYLGLSADPTTISPLRAATSAAGCRRYFLTEPYADGGW
jgi:hypothetical protein